MRKNTKNTLFFVTLTITVIIAVVTAMALKYGPNTRSNYKTPKLNSSHTVITSAPTSIPTPSLTPVQVPNSYVIPHLSHSFQTFNNCGPSSLSMALSYHGITASQQVLGNSLRPYQVANGDNDDKSVRLDELAKEAEKYGFATIHRPGGNIDLMKKFIANDMPVITRTLTHVDEDIGHYRLLRGYDSNSLIQDDSLQGKDLRYSNDEFNALWKRFNYEYLVIVPNEKLELAKEIAGEDWDTNNAWQKTLSNAEKQLSQNPQDIFARFNLSVALYHVGRYQEAIANFEQIERALPFRTLWYQQEPIEAYYKSGDYDEVFKITSDIIENGNRAYTEGYMLRGKSYEKLGQTENAKIEYQKALLYNKNLQEAKDALNRIN